MSMPGNQRNELREAICAVFEPDTFKMWLREFEPPIDADIAEGSLKVRADALIRHFEQLGLLDYLILHLVRARGTNERVNNYLRQYAPHLAPTSPAPPRAVVPNRGSDKSADPPSSTTHALPGRKGARRWLWLVAVVLAGTGGVLLGQTVWPPPNWEPSLTQAHAQLLVTVREELQQSRAQAHTLRLARIREELQRSDQRLRETISLLETLNVTITRLRIILSDLLNGAYGPVKKKDPDKKDKEVDTEVKKKALVLNHCITVLSKVHLDLCERGGKSPWDVAGVADAKDQLMKASDPALEKVIEPEVLAAIKAGDPNSFRRIQEHDETLKTLPALVARLEQRYQPGEICAEGLANLLDKRKPLLAELADLERHLTEANSR